MQNFFKTILISFLLLSVLSVGVFLRFAKETRILAVTTQTKIQQVLNLQASFSKIIEKRLAEKSEEVMLDNAQNYCKEGIALNDNGDKQFCFRKSKLTEPKGIEVDLTNNKALLYEEGKLFRILPLLYQAPEDKWFQSPTGYYRIGVKKEKHWSSLFPVAMPYAIQYYEDFFMHGIPYLSDNTRLSNNFTGGCLRFADDVAEEIYNFLRTGDQIVVYKTFDDLKIKDGFSPPVDLKDFWIRQRFGNPYRQFWAHSGDIENLKFDYYEHTGLDFAPELGSDNLFIHSIADGEISEIQLNDKSDHGLGNTIIIKHQNGDSVFYSLYAHLDSIKNSLEKGSAVKRGEVIGVVGDSGNGCRNYWRVGPESCNGKSPLDTHLHFEVKTLSTLANPGGGEICRRNDGSARLCYGYTPDNPKNFGYEDPIEFLFEKNQNN